MRRGLAAATVLLMGAAAAQAAPPTTTQRVVAGETGAAYGRLLFGPGWKRVVRSDLAAAKAGREKRRTSMLYFAQLTDFQLADEESPARVESLDQPNTPFTAAWRPQEALEPFTIDQAIRQVNRFAGRSPLAARKRRHAKLALALLTGDNADNQQRNEVTWVRELLEGGTVDPNSGVESDAPCAAGIVKKGEAAKYTGVQDHDDVADSGRFYDPDQPTGTYAAFPSWPGLMDRAEEKFTAQGLKVPSYYTFGNHDGTIQGNLWASKTFNDVATGCAKPLTFAGIEPAQIASALTNSFAVPPDPQRGFLSRADYMKVSGAGRQPDDHGFAFVGKGEAKASNGSATYYSFKRGRIRFVALNTVGEGSQINPDGNLDDPQFRWVERTLKAADKHHELVILFGHHPIRTMTNDSPDENAPSCASSPQDPGCDGDPRSSQPLHLGPDLQALLLAHRSVIAYVAGHTHQHNVEAFRAPAAGGSGEGGGGFWGIETSSEVDWPIQSRLLEVMDNHDGTLSIFGTLIDHGAALTTPPTGTKADGFTPLTLASIARELSFNDPQQGGTTGMGDPDDRNVELLLPDPRT
ncbi:MAG: TIGR03767 family metallophosphoesterase [Solirubrobacteraceae bacterium]